jgi:hypothetical protein
MENKDYYYVEALIKIESSSPDFVTRYEWLILEIDNNDEEIAVQKATEYLNKNYNREYMGGVPIKLSLVRIISINPSIHNRISEVIEIYSVPFTDLTSFEKFRESYP